MTVAAIVMLGVTGLLSAVLWWQVDPRRHAIGLVTAIAALGLPALVLAAAAIFAVAADDASDLERSLAVVLGATSAVTGGGVVATCVLRLADRFVGRRAPTHGDALPQPGTPAPAPPPPPMSSPPPPPPMRDDPATAGGMTVTPGSLSPTGITTTSGSARGPVHDTVSDPDTLRGGAWIGALERLAIVATLLTRWPEGLAVILAVKGLGRYPELRRPAAAERFIIGTMASALWAIACVGVVVAVGGVYQAG